MAPSCPTGVRRRSALALLPLCALLAAGAAFVGGFQARPSSMARAAAPAGDDFDFGDVATGGPKPGVKPPPIPSADDEEDLYEVYDPDAERRAALRSGESEGGNNAAIGSVALIAALVIGAGIFLVNDQSNAFKGGSQEAAPRTKKVQAKYDTYFDKGEAAAALSDQKAAEQP